MNTTSTISTTSDDNVSQHLRALADEAEALLKATANAGDQTYEAVRARGCARKCSACVNV